MEITPKGKTCSKSCWRSWPACCALSSHSSLGAVPDGLCHVFPSSPNVVLIIAKVSQGRNKPDKQKSHMSCSLPKNRSCPSVSPAAIAGIGTEMILRVSREMQSSGKFPATLECCHSFYWDFFVCVWRKILMQWGFSLTAIEESTICVYVVIKCKYMPCT